MTSRQNKSSPRKRGGRGGKALPKAKSPRRRAARTLAAQRPGNFTQIPARSRAVIYDGLSSLPPLGISSTSISTKHGPGLLVRGCTVLAYAIKYNGVITANDYSVIFNEATTLNNYTVWVHPFYLQEPNYATRPSRLALLAQAYTMFRFRRLRLHYTPQCGTTETNLFAAAYFADIRQIISAPPSSATFSQLVDKDGNTMVTQPWAAAAADFSRELDDEYFYVDVDSTSNAGIRQTIQGGIYSGWQYPHPENTNSDVGMFWVEYECELVQPYTVQNYALQSDSKLPMVDCKRLLTIPMETGEKTSSSVTSSCTPQPKAASRALSRLELEKSRQRCSSSPG